ncbi:nucleotide modification associated domain-containing protein [Ruminiclostridium josui]|uniref:nucleotide modification associated domain-containing protein n=1 Tax=Ruminiclostridium josui TaxID=1499 RepID=UPI000463CAC0|nr:nucleotide modification associated domain-containing protein [Ruminiclostridium josui]
MNNKNKFDRHKQLCEELNEVYKDKNIAYGDSFGKTFQELGVISAVTRMYDKFNRIKALSTGAENKVMDESLKDTFKDMANYCIMTLIELEIQEQRGSEDVEGD